MNSYTFLYTINSYMAEDWKQATLLLRQSNITTHVHIFTHYKIKQLTNGKCTVEPQISNPN